MITIKKLSALSIVILMSMAIVSCGEKKYSKYQCPMKCEKEKTYDEQGKCPVCGMKLKGIK